MEISRRSFFSRSAGSFIAHVHGHPVQSAEDLLRFASQFVIHRGGLGQRLGPALFTVASWGSITLSYRRCTHACAPSWQLVLYGSVWDVVPERGLTEFYDAATASELKPENGIFLACLGMISECAGEGQRAGCVSSFVDAAAFP